ncbi:hypothetical protein CDV31_017106 [Fusarium ambrosium]|uniref:Uncharacterized protein n=1 Tax=Fusarium ambrosium TaxID=131363 RepID=A0A428RSV6_9HYPO|nr:hypothetical protein CDV31_017106 [Fusarium ambrosium]
MSNDEAYLRVPNHREGRGLRKRKSDTILSPGRSKSPRQAKADENERADDNRRTDGGVDDTLPAKSLQSAPPSNDEHLVSEEPEQDGSQTRLEVDDEPRDDGDMDQLMAIGGWSVYVTESRIANGATRMPNPLRPTIILPPIHVPDPTEGSPSGQRTRQLEERLRGIEKTALRWTEAHPPQ